MITKRKNIVKFKQENFHMLSYAEKIRKIQQITKVPLLNIKSNIIQSDLEEDDISLPICVEIQEKKQKNNSSLNKIHKYKKIQNKNKINCQNHLNKVIKCLTKQLGLFSTDLNTLRIDQFKQNKHNQKSEYDQAVNTSFSQLNISQLKFQQNPQQILTDCREQQMKEFYNYKQNCRQQNNSKLDKKIPPLNEIIIQNFNYIPLIFKQKQVNGNNLKSLNSQKKGYRPVNCLQMVQKLNIQSISIYDQQSNRKFGRTKRYSFEPKQQNEVKRLRFNRSNRKSNQKSSIDINNINKYNQNQEDLAIIRNQHKNIEEFKSNINKQNQILERNSLEVFNFKNSYIHNIQNVWKTIHSLNPKRQEKNQNIKEDFQDKVNIAKKQLVQNYSLITKNKVFEQIQKGQFINNQQIIPFIAILAQQYKKLFNYCIQIQ